MVRHTKFQLKTIKIRLMLQSRKNIRKWEEVLGVGYQTREGVKCLETSRNKCGPPSGRDA